MAGYIISAIIVVFCGGMFFLLLKYPKSTFISYITKWQYRIMRRIRWEYYSRLLEKEEEKEEKKKPDSYDYFYAQAIAIIRDDLKSHRDKLISGESRFQKAEEIIEMLNYPQFIHHFFTGFGVFSGEVFHNMYQDFRTGEYRKDYSDVERLRKILPIEISSSPGAFNDFMKLVKQGWFDINSGKYIQKDGRTKQQIGRAIYWVCHRNNIKSPAKVFAPFWGEDVDTVKGWCRVQPRSPHITEQDDIIILEILRK